MEIVLAALLDTLVDVVTAVGVIAVVLSLSVITVVFAVEAFDHYQARKQRQRSWAQAERAREGLAEDIAKDEAVASLDFPPREHSAGRKSA